MTRKSFCGLAEGRRTVAEDIVVVVSSNRALDKSGMNAFFSRLVRTGRKRAVEKIRFDLVEKRVLKQHLK